MDLLTLLSDDIWPDISVFYSPVLAAYSQKTVAQICSKTKSLVGSMVLEVVIYSSKTDLSNHFGHRISICILCESHFFFWIYRC